MGVFSTHFVPLISILAPKILEEWNNQLYNSDFCKLLRPHISPILKKNPLSMLILDQISCFLGPTIFKIPQPNWYFSTLHSGWIWKQYRLILSAFCSCCLDIFFAFVFPNFSIFCLPADEFDIIVVLWFLMVLVKNKVFNVMAILIVNAFLGHTQLCEQHL